MGGERRALLATAVRRGLTIIAIGLALNLFPHFNFATVRIPGVLQRLGLCTILTAPLVLYFNWRQQIGWIVGLLAGYALLMLNLTVPDADGLLHTGSLARGQDVGAWLDRRLMGGHLWVQAKTWDPEGLLSHRAGGWRASCFGVLVGHWLCTRRQAIEKAMWLMVRRTGPALAGTARRCLADADQQEPLDAFLCGLRWPAGAAWCSAVSLLAARCDARCRCSGRGMAGWMKPFVVFGMNALFIFALSGLVARILGLVHLDSGPTVSRARCSPPSRR